MAISNQVEPGLKLSAVREYLAGSGSLNKIAEKYGVYRSTLQKWLLNYVMSLSWYARKLTQGTAGLKKSKGNRGGEKQAAKPDGEDSA